METVILIIVVVAMFLNMALSTFLVVMVTNHIKVVTVNKVVYLLGRNAGKPYQIKGAITGIEGISDVQKVVNLIGQ